MEDNYSLWEQHQRKLDQEEARYPECSYCGHPITEADGDLYDIEGELYHERCMNEQFRKPVGDYML